MRASTAYFVGAGTIVAAIAIGLGGGIVAGNIMNPVAPKQGPDTGKMAQRAGAAAAVVPVKMDTPSERVQYLTGSQNFGAVVAPTAQAQGEAKPDIQTTEANAQPPAPQPSQAAAVEPPTPPASAPASPPQVAKPVEQQASTEPSPAPNNAYAKARDSEVKRPASERRRAERRERWTERRQYDSSRSPRDRSDWDDIARNVREDSNARDYAGRSRGGLQRPMLFGPDDD